MTAHRVARYQATGIGGKDNKAGGGRGATLWDRALGNLPAPAEERMGGPRCEDGYGFLLGSQL
jgi:hypothetical protein